MNARETTLPHMLSIGDRHPVYGEVSAVGIRDGEGYYMFIDRFGVVSLMPRDVIDREPER